MLNRPLNANYNYQFEFGYRWIKQQAQSPSYDTITFENLNIVTESCLAAAQNPLLFYSRNCYYSLLLSFTLTSAALQIICESNAMVNFCFYFLIFFLCAFLFFSIIYIFLMFSIYTSGRLIVQNFRAACVRRRLANLKRILKNHGESCLFMLIRLSWTA